MRLQECRSRVKVVVNVRSCCCCWLRYAVVALAVVSIALLQGE